MKKKEIKSFFRVRKELSLVALRICVRIFEKHHNWGVVTECIETALELMAEIIFPPFNYNFSIFLTLLMHSFFI